MSKVTTREELKDFIHRRLGAPCIKTADLADEQFDDIVDFTLDRFYEQAIGFSQEERVLYMPVEEGISYVDLSDVEPQVTASISVIGDYDSNIWNNLNRLFTIENMLIHKWGFNLYTPDLITFQAIYDWMDFFNTMYGLEYRVEINEHGKNARIFPFPKHSGSIFTLVTVKRPESELYNFSWVRDYVFAKCLVQIGMNRSKFTGISLPGGGTLNGDMYITKGEAMIEKLDQQLLEQWSEPPDFIVG